MDAPIAQAKRLSYLQRSWPSFGTCFRSERSDLSTFETTFRGIAARYVLSIGLKHTEIAAAMSGALVSALCVALTSSRR